MPRLWPVLLLVVPCVSGADPPKKGGVIVLESDPAIARPFAYLASQRRVIDRARRSLALCEDPRGNTEVDLDVKVAPNGEVESVSVAARGPTSEDALACLQRNVRGLVFEPLGGVGYVLRLAVVMGEPSSSAPAPLPFDVQSTTGKPTFGPIVARLPSSPAPLLAAAREIEHAAKACARPGIVTVQALVTDAGDVAKLDVDGTSPLAVCLRGAKWHDGSGHVSRLTVKVTATSSEVTLAP